MVHQLVALLIFAPTLHCLADGREVLRSQLRELAASRPNWGYRRLTLLLRRQGWVANHKPVFRLYREEALGLRRRLPRRRVSAARREAAPAPSRCNETWSMDFMAGQLYSGQPIRILTTVDSFGRESLALRAGFRLTGEDVAGVPNELIRGRGVPDSIPADRRSAGIAARSSHPGRWTSGPT